MSDLALSSKKISKKTALIVIAAAVLLRLILSIAYETQFDVYAYKLWLDDIKSVGLFNMYNWTILENSVDYPPIFPTLLWLTVAPVDKLISATGIIASSFSFKLIPLLADLLIIALLYRKCNPFVSMLWALNPATIVTSTMWAQSDSLIILFLLLFLFTIIEDKIWLVGVMLALSVLIKPQGIYLVPVYILYLVVNKASIKTRILSFCVGVSTGALVWLPFMLHFQGIMLPFNVYLGASRLFNAYSVNCANVWTLQVNVEQPHYFENINYILLILCVALFVYMYIKSKDIVLSTAAYLFLVCMITLNQHERYPVYALTVFLLVYFLNKDTFARNSYIIGVGVLGIYELIILLVADNYLPSPLSENLFVITQLLDAAVNFVILILIVKNYMIKTGKTKGCLK